MLPQLAAPPLEPLKTVLLGIRLNRSVFYQASGNITHVSK